MAILILMPERNQDSITLQKHLLRLNSNLDVRIWPDCGNTTDIEFIISWKHPHGELQQFRNCRVVCSYGAGVDHIFTDAGLPENILVCRTSDKSLAQQMAEYISWAIANHLRGLRHYVTQQQNTQWQAHQPTSFISALDQVTTTSDHASIGILGLGQLGQHCAKVLQLCGYRLLGWSRRLKSLPGVECYDGTEGLNKLLQQSSILICLLPLTPDTENILDYTLLKKLPPQAYLINTARGQHLVEEDLITILDEGHLAGACLDVFREEPLPTSHPFWLHPKITVTPHISSLTNPTSAARQIHENYRRYINKQNLLNVVNPLQGY